MTIATLFPSRQELSVVNRVKRATAFLAPLLTLAALVLLVLFAGSPAFGQADQGTITGVVTDPSGAAVPDAQVTLKSADTGLVLTAKSDQRGVYTFPPVQIGNSSVTASATGFAVTTQKNLELGLQQRL